MTPAPRRGEAGQTLVFVSIFMVVCLCFVGVVIDGGMFFFERRDMQGTADAAALAAVRELPKQPGQASTVANDYVTSKNSAASALVRSVTFTDANRSVEVVVHKKGSAGFSGVLGLAPPDISARAVARVQMMGPRPGMLPMAFMRDTYTIGENYEVKFDGTTTAASEHGPIAPDVMPDCSGATGAADFRSLIAGAAHGGVDACPTPIAETLDLEPGQMAGPTRQGFDERLGSSTDSYSDVFGTDPASGFQTIEKPTSPRIGIVPIIENLNGTTAWPNGRKEIRILGYMLVYIGKVDSSGYPAYTNNGKSVWVTPVRPILPADFTDGEFVDYSDNLTSPVAFRLVE
ncbi:MAG: putative Flp pilus-assembly TadE/G-like [Thermoleophilia bacterium]|nr:putative Flp pilus-assembly TadE/G-like [Thermoleophilia bacterium]